MYNEVVLNYVQRAMVNIQAAQRRIISEFASTCMNDIATCYSQQVTQVNAWSTAASTASVYNIMKGACRNIALTCSFAVFMSDETSCPVTNQSATACQIPTNIDVNSATMKTHCENVCIENVSNIFFQSMLCPENSEWFQKSGGVPAIVGEIYSLGNHSRVFVNEKCLCLPNFGYVSGRCTPLSVNQKIDSTCTTIGGTCAGINVGCTNNTQATSWGTCTATGS